MAEQNTNGNPPLPKGFTPIKREEETAPLPKGFTPLKKKESADSASITPRGNGGSEQTNGSLDSQKFNEIDAFGGKSNVEALTSQATPQLVKPSITTDDLQKGIADSLKPRGAVNPTKQAQATMDKVQQNELETNNFRNMVKEKLGAYRQATQLDDTNQQEANTELNDLKNENGFLNTLKSKASQFGNFLTTGAFKKDNPLEEQENQAKQEFKEKGVAPTKEQLSKRADELFIEQKLDNAKQQKVNDYLAELDVDTKRYLEVDADERYKTLSQKSKEITDRIALNSKYGNSIADELDNPNLPIEDRQMLEEELLRVSKDIEKDHNTFSKDTADLGTTEEELDAFKRNYGAVENFTQRAVTSIGNAGIDLAQGLDYVGTLGGTIPTDEKDDKKITEQLAGARSGIEAYKEKFRPDNKELTTDNFLQYSTDMLGDMSGLMLEMATGNPTGLLLVGTGGAGRKVGEMKAEELSTGKKFTSAQMAIAPLISGTSEAALNALPVGKALQGTKRVWLSLGENETKEAIEQATKSLKGRLFTDAEHIVSADVQMSLNNVVQNTINKDILGKDDVSYFDNGWKVLTDATLLTGMIRGTGTLPHVAMKGVKMFTPAEKVKTLDVNGGKIIAIEKQLQDPNISPTVKSALESQKKAITKESSEIVSESIDKMSKMDESEVKSVLSDIKKTEEIVKTVEEIKSDDTKSDTDKKVVLQALKEDYTATKDKIQEKLNETPKETAERTETQPQAEVSELSKVEPTKEVKSEEQKKSVEVGESGKVQWDVYGNEESGEWTVGEKTKTRGGKDAVVLSKQYVEDSTSGKVFTKEYADKNGIKYDNEHTVTHIVPIEDLNKQNETNDKTFTTHTGEEVSGKRLDNALNKVADDWAENAKSIKKEDAYADHVDEKTKEDNLKKGLETAEKIRRGENIDNATIWQRVNKELTGETVALLPETAKSKSNEGKTSRNPANDEAMGFGTEINREGDKSGRNDEVIQDIQPASELRADSEKAKVDFAKEQIEKGVTQWSGDMGSPRVDLGISWADIRKGEADLKRGKTDSVPAKRLVEALDKAKKEGGYHYKYGTGTESARAKEFVSLEDMQRSVNENKLTDAEIAEINKNEESLAKEYEDYFNSLDESTQNEILENYENKPREVSGNPEGREGKTDVPNKEKGITEATRKLAEEVRKLKISRPDAFQSHTPASLAWDLGVEAVAKTIEATGNVAQAVSDGLEAIKSTEWYKNLSEDKKAQAEASFEKSLEVYKPKEESALKNADIEIKRNELGLEPREKVIPKTNESLVESAKTKIKEGFDTETLIDEILDIKSTRTLTPEEVVILKQYQLAKESQLIELGDNIVEATKEGKGTALDKLIEDRNKIIDEIDRAYRAGEQSGTITARALQARKIALMNDYSLANMLIQKRKANNGEKLSSEQINEVTTEYAEIKELKAKLEAKIASLEAENNTLKAGKNVDFLRRQNTRKAKVESIDKSIDETFASLKKKMREQQGRLSANAIPVEMIPDIAKLAKLYAQKGIVKLEDIVDNIYMGLKEYVPNISKEDVNEVIASYDFLAEAKEEKRLSSFKNRSLKKIDELMGKIERKDFVKQETAPVKLDFEAQKIKDDLRTAKFKWEKALEQDRLSKRTKMEKARDYSTEIFNLPRAIMASIDYSAPLRQGLVMTVNHPVIASKAFVEMFKQSISEKKSDRWLEDLKESPQYEVMEKSGLYVADTHNAKLSAKEEQFMSNLALKIPIIGGLIKGSERAYVGYLNKLRADVFSQSAKAFESEGLTVDNSPKLYKALGDYVNCATGRGNLGKFEESAQILNSAFFSPRLMASRVRLLTNWANPSWYAKTPAKVRMMYAGDMIKMVLAGSSLLALLKVSDDDDEIQVETDPRSSDFGKVKVGDARWDIWGGHQQWARFITQMITAQRKSTKDGAIREIDGEGFRGETRMDLVLNMTRSKLAPVPATVWNLTSGKTLVGDEYELKDVPKSFLPLFAADFYRAMERDGIVKGTLQTGLPGAFGIGVQNYSDKDKQTGGSESKRQDMIEKKLKNALKPIDVIIKEKMESLKKRGVE